MLLLHSLYLPSRVQEDTLVSSRQFHMHKAKEKKKGGGCEKEVAANSLVRAK